MSLSIRSWYSISPFLKQSSIYLNSSIITCVTILYSYGIQCIIQRTYYRRSRDHWKTYNSTIWICTWYIGPLPWRWHLLSHFLEAMYYFQGNFKFPFSAIYYPLFVHMSISATSHMPFFPQIVYHYEKSGKVSFCELSVILIMSIVHHFSIIFCYMTCPWWVPVHNNRNASPLPSFHCSAPLLSCDLRWRNEHW